MDFCSITFELLTKFLSDLMLSQAPGVSLSAALNCNLLLRVLSSINVNYEYGRNQHKPNEQRNAISLRSLYLATRAIRPHARSAVLVKVQSCGAGDFDRLAVDAVVEDVAHRRIGVGEETVSSRALLRRLWRFCWTSIVVYNQSCKAHIAGLVAVEVTAGEVTGLWESTNQSETVHCLADFQQPTVTSTSQPKMRLVV